VFFNYVQRYQGFVTAVPGRCSPVASPRSGKRLGSPSREQQLGTSHLRTDVDPCIIEW
jgi:hypothetical protein